MYIFPIRRFEIMTSLKPDEILHRISEYTERVKLFRSPVMDESEHLPYQGYKIHNGFRISRVLNYRNSFNPEIVGRFSETPKGTTLSVTVKAATVVMVFLIVFLVLLTGLTSLFWMESGFSTELLLLPGVYFFLYIIMMVYINSEYEDTVQFFRELLEGEIEMNAD